VLASGDAPFEPQHAALASVLTEYVFEPNMSSYSALRAATERLIARHGPIHRLDSNGEHWLEFEGRLRDDFAVPGLSHARTLALGSRPALAPQLGA
jgi:hypothetical protein